MFLHEITVGVIASSWQQLSCFQRVEQADNKTGKRTRRKRKSKTSQVKKGARELELGDERLRAYGVNPKKFKKKLKYLKKTNADIKG